MAAGKASATNTAERKKLFAVLAELGGGTFSAEDDVVIEGTRIVLPTGMTIPKAITYLTQREEADRQTTVFSRKYKYRPWDGAVCTWRAMKRVFGMVGLQGTPGSFGDDPPEMREVPIGPHETETVPWGQFTLPLLPHTVITPGAYMDEEWGILFSLEINAPRKFRAQVEGIFAVVAEELATASIYRGKAFDGQEMAEFLDLSGVDPTRVVYTAETQTQLEANIWSVLRYRDQLLSQGISLKRSALLYGQYGTGKTLGGFLTAQIATDNGWTFLYARPGKDDMQAVMQMARLYQPACVFFEDLDTVANAQDQKADMASQLLDLFDGVTAKGTQLMVVLTTNHPDRIHKGMLRPGRLDAVIEIGELDPPGVRGLIQMTLPVDSLAENIDWEEVFTACKGMLPAYVKEVADRAYRYALSRSEGRTEDILLVTEDLVHAANGLRPQLDLMEGASEHKIESSLEQAFREVARQGHVEAVAKDYQPNYGFLKETVAKEVYKQA